jgi:C4-dicarboxylate-specific signal transduction histidine kinase
LQEERAPTSGAATIGAPVARLDVETVVKASQAVSGEIVLENLIKTLMVIAVEHAGAERGLLILPRGDQLWVEAEATTGLKTVEVNLRQALVTRSACESFSTRIEKRYRRKDGGVIWAEVDSFRAPLAGSAPVLAAVAVDITEHKLAEASLRDARADLERMARLTTMGELTASIAHEINQPLAAIVTQSEAALRFLERGEPDLDEARDPLSSIRQDGIRAGEVIHGLRSLAKKSGPQLAKLDIDDVVRQVLAISRGELVRHNVVLRTELASDERPILGDQVQLQQVLLNLIMNGVEAMKSVADRTRELTISSTLAEPSSVLVAVQDTGTGMDPGAERMFQPFFTTKSDGLGMGLAICRSIVEAHGGRLSAPRRAPHGADVHFTLPLWVDQ